MSKSALNNSHHSQFQVISLEEQVENDKERIRRRFNFSSSNTNSLNSSKISDIQSKLSFCTIQKNSNKNKNEHIIIENDNSDKSSLTDINEQPIGNNETLNKKLNDEDYYNVENSSRVEEFDLNEKTKKIIIQLKIKE